MAGLVTGYPGELIRIAIPVIAGLLLHSTLLIGSVLVLLRLVRNRGAALQAAVIRGGLATLFCIPLVQIFMTLSGVIIPLPGLTPENHIAAPSDISQVQWIGSMSPDMADLISGREKTTITSKQVSDHHTHTVNPQTTDKIVEAVPQGDTGVYRQSVSIPILPPKQVEPFRIVEQQTQDRRDTNASYAKVHQDGNVSKAEPSRVLTMLYVAFIAAWGLATVLLALRMIAGIWYVRHLRLTASIGPNDMQHRCQAIAQQLHMPSPLVYEHSRVFSTFIAGLTRPYIMVPANDTGALLASDEVFMHELAHQKHHDIHWHIIGQILLLFYPIQPLLWLLVRQAELISDYRADDYVVALAENNIAYARTLHGIACALTVKNQEMRGYVPAISFFNRKSSLTTRIMRILDRDRNRPLSARLRDLVTLSVLLTCTVVFTGFVRFEPAPEYDIEQTMGRQRQWQMTTSENRTPKLSMSPRVITSEQDVDDFSQGSKPLDTGEYDEPSSGEHIANRTTLHNNTAPAPSGNSFHEPKRPVTDADIMTDNSRPSMEHAIIPDEHMSDRDTGTDSAYLGDGRHSIVEPEQMTQLQNPDDSSITDTVSGTQTANVQGQGAQTPDDMSGSPGTGQLIKEEKSPEAMIAFRGETLPAFRSGTRIAIPATKAINVIIDDYNTEDYDLSDPEQRKQYLLYQSLEKNHNEPAWSPDGKWIAFTDFSRIWLVPAEGGEPRQVYENFHADTNYTVGGIKALTYSPDGTTLTFQKNVYDTSRGSRFKEYENGLAIFSKPVVNVERIDIETGAHEVLVQDAYQCHWSLSGRYLFFRTWNKLDDLSQGIWASHGQPMLLDTETNEMHSLAVPGDEQIGSVSFLPDDSALIVPCREGTITNLWKIDLVTAEQSNLTAGVTSTISYRHYDYPACSPDGKWVLFTDFSAIGEEINRRLLLLSLESGEVFYLQGEIQGNASHGIWSPDGRNICFLEEKQGGSYLQVIDFYPDQYPVSKPTAIEDEEAQPYAFDLAGNYPNPFNPTTRIEYGIESAGEVILDIYNVLGQRIRRLVQEPLPEGRHSAVWDGRDDRGIEAATGMYIARLVSGNRLATLKMTLQK